MTVGGEEISGKENKTQIITKQIRKCKQQRTSLSGTLLLLQGTMLDMIRIFWTFYEFDNNKTCDGKVDKDGDDDNNADENL